MKYIPFKMEEKILLKLNIVDSFHKNTIIKSNKNHQTPADSKTLRLKTTLS